MQNLDERVVSCPYCGEAIEVLLDCSVHHQNYIEDCQVCCRPIVFDVRVDSDGDAMVAVYSENE